MTDVPPQTPDHADGASQAVPPAPIWASNAAPSAASAPFAASAGGAAGVDDDGGPPRAPMVDPGPPWVPGDEGPAPQPSQPSPDGVDDGPPPGLWQKMRADPEYAPEHLALEAVTRIGPKMVLELQKLRAQNPGAPPEAIASMVAYRYTNHARLSGAVSGAVGLAGAVLDVGVLAWTQAKMVLLIAVAYGHDPADPERATELLVLQGVHKYTQTARTALQVARGREGIGALLPDKRRPINQMLLTLGLKLAQMAGVKAAKRIFAKIVPGAAIILGSFANAGATKALAKKAIELYGRPALPMQRPPMQLPPAPKRI
ncbi:EcsC family protein [Dactylosporangium sp. NPDC050588]|uniref:EcsC family protein n=1 Tax=Dactylosporangium sp. NPDC050588 TaxID=3157211 RepID=UPI0033CE3311